MLLIWLRGLSINAINDAHWFRLTCCRILAAWYLVGQDVDFPVPGFGIQNLTLPHEQVDARIPESKPILLEGAIAGHVLLKNENNALPFTQKLTMLSVFGYDATIPRTKNTDNLFQLGYTSSEEMGQAVLGTPERFDQAARGGTIVTGGRAGANAPAYIIDVCSCKLLAVVFNTDKHCSLWQPSSIVPP